MIALKCLVVSAALYWVSAVHKTTYCSPLHRKHIIITALFTDQVNNVVQIHVALEPFVTMIAVPTVPWEL